LKVLKSSDFSYFLDVWTLSKLYAIEANVSLAQALAVTTVNS